MSDEVEIDISKVTKQDKNGEKGADEGKAKKTKLKKETEKDGSISVTIGGQKIRKIKRATDKEKKTDTLTGETTVVVKKDSGDKEYEMDVKVVVDCSTDPATITTTFSYWGERFKEIDQISHAEQKKLLDWMDENKILAMMVLPGGNDLPEPGFAAFAYLSPESARDPTLIRAAVERAASEIARESQGATTPDAVPGVTD